MAAAKQARRSGQQYEAEFGREDLTAEDLRALAERGRRLAVPKGTVVVNEGDRSDAVFIIAAGRVKVFVRGTDGREAVINEQGPGEYFGDLALDAGPRSASVATLEASRFHVVTREDFRAFVASHPDFAMRLIGRLMHRVRVLTTNVRNLALLDVYGRVVELLEDLAEERHGRLVVPVKLTQKDIATRIGSSREMVSRILKDLVTGGYVKLEKGRIAIERPLPRRW